VVEVAVVEARPVMVAVGSEIPVCMPMEELEGMEVIGFDVVVVVVPLPRFGG
jgi:hypothetical protein